MTADDIADQVAAILNAAADPPQLFEAEKPTDTAAAQVEVSGLRVFVLPYEETETRTDYGASRRNRVVSVVVNGPISHDFDRADGMQFSEWVREQLEGTEIASSDADNASDYTWEQNETISLYDTEALKTKNQFLSLARATYYSIA